MMDYQLLLLAHLLLFVYWLGADFAVFYTSRYVVDETLGMEARITSARILLAIDQLPRVCLILMLPVGLALADRTGLIALNAAVLFAICVAAAFWLLMVSTIHHRSGQPIAAKLQRIDLVLRVVVIAVLLFVAIRSFMTGAPIAQNWLALKLALFAGLMSAGLAIRIAFRPFGPAFAKLAQGESSPEYEETVRRCLRRTKPFVMAIWIGLIAMAWIGLTRPAI